MPFLKEADLGIVDMRIEKKSLPAGGGIILQGQPMIQQRIGQTPDVVQVILSHTSDDPKNPVGFDFEDQHWEPKFYLRPQGLG